MGLPSHCEKNEEASNALTAYARHRYYELQKFSERVFAHMRKYWQGWWIKVKFKYLPT